MAIHEIVRAIPTILAIYVIMRVIPIILAFISSIIPGFVLGFFQSTVRFLAVIVEYFALTCVTTQIVRAVDHFTHPKIYDYQTDEEPFGVPWSHRRYRCFTCTAFITQQVQVHCDHIYCSECLDYFYKDVSFRGGPLTRCFVDHKPIKVLNIDELFKLDAARWYTSALLLGLLSDFVRILYTAFGVCNGPAVALGYTIFGYLKSEGTLAFLEWNIVVRTCVLPLDLLYFWWLIRSYHRLGQGWWRSLPYIKRYDAFTQQLLWYLGIHGYFVLLLSML